MSDHQSSLSIALLDCNQLVNVDITSVYMSLHQEDYTRRTIPGGLYQEDYTRRMPGIYVYDKIIWPPLIAQTLTGDISRFS